MFEIEIEFDDGPLTLEVADWQEFIEWYEWAVEHDLDFEYDYVG